MDNPALIVDEVVRQYRAAPIDLLGRNDGEGEWHYLNHLKSTYVDTVQSVHERLGVAPGNGARKHVLEIGAYLGVVSLSLKRLGFDVTAQDIPDFMGNPRLQELYRRAGVNFAIANLRDHKLPHADGTFDAVVMCEVLEHLNFNPVPVLLEINRVLKTGGVLYLALPNLARFTNRFKLALGKSPYTPVDAFFAQLSDQGNMIVGIHWREYTLAEVRQLLERLGFVVERQMYYDFEDRNQLTLAKELIRRVLYALSASFKPGQATWARKARCPELKLHFSDATR
ncbi:MAG: class I SAM-dependent methyltransferase [Verrucomicrobiota bacterium]